MSRTAPISDDSPAGLAPALSDAEAWARLPPAGAGAGQPLPAWARMLAGALPRTAAAMLRVDFAHRTQSPLDPPLRAVLRWAAAHENRCAYAEAYAVADACRAGLTPDLVKADRAPWSPAERAAVRFARRMTADSAAVTDAEFAELVGHFGERQAAAMVLLTAWANFQDRLLLCLGAAVEEAGPLPPTEVVFRQATPAAKSPPPAPARDPLPSPTGAGRIADAPAWTALTYEMLQGRLDAQRRRAARVSVPAWDVVGPGLPPGLFPRPSQNVWDRVCLGHVPELAVPWEAFMRAAFAEAGPKMDRVFAVGLFWVTTKAVACPYCMGHCEMNWEVAGLSKAEVAERSRLLAGGDWSSFPPEQQRAFAFARKLAEKPAAVSGEDIAGLRRDFGAAGALVVALSAARYHYMTRISNGFQLTLEPDNVFYDYWNVPRPAAAAP